MKVCIAGKNTIGHDVLRFFVERLGADALLALPNSDDLGRHTWQHSLRRTAQELGVREVTMAEIYEIEDLLFLSVEYNLIIKPHLFKTTRLFNIHFSHLPKYKGMYTSIWPILNGEVESGVTLHRIDKGIDTGDVIAQATFPVELHHTSRDLYFNYMRAGTALILNYAEQLLCNTVMAHRQPATAASYYSKQSIDYTQLAVRFRATAFQVHNFVRGFSFYEYQLPHAFDAPVWKSEITDEPSTGKPGEIVYEDDSCFVVSTIDYNVRLYKDFSLRLFAAVEANDVATVRSLAPRVHSLNLTNRQGWSPLMVASYRHYPEVVATLLEAGADVNQINLSGTAVLMYAKDGALAAGSTDLLTYLLAHGADLHHRDGSGRSVLDYCLENGNTEMVVFLRTHGARPATPLN